MRSMAVMMLSLVVLGAVCEAVSLAALSEATLEAPVKLTDGDGFSLGYAKGFALGIAHSNAADGEGDVASFLQLAETLAPMYDDYEGSEHKAHSHHTHHIHHAHGSNPEPEMDLEDSFLAHYADALPQGTRPAAPLSKISSYTPKSISKLQVDGEAKTTGTATATSASSATGAASDKASSETESQTASTEAQEVAKTESDQTVNQNAKRLEDQEKRIQELEASCAKARTKLDMYERQQSSMSAGAGLTDGSGKTEFIKGYEGGFKVGYEAGWNMATADLKKRYGFPDNTGHTVDKNNSTANATAPAEVSSLAQPPAAPANPVPVPPAAAGPATAGTTTSTGPATTDNKPQANNFNVFRNSLMNGNNPFFTQDMVNQEPPHQQLVQQYAPQDMPVQQQPQFNMGFQQQNMPQFQAPQQMEFQAPNNMLAPQGFDMAQLQQMQQQQPQQGFFGSNTNTQADADFRPVGLPAKAMQFLSNIKGMIQEGKDTITAVQNALHGNDQPAQQPAMFSQMPMQMPMQMQQMQQMQPNFAPSFPQQGFNSMPQQTFNAAPQQGFNAFPGMQGLVQTDAPQAQAAAPASSLLSGLAGLLSGGAAKPEQDFGLTNLAQLLATTTGNQALPKPVAVQPGQDSATLGIQEMQNMIQEGQRPVTV